VRRKPDDDFDKQEITPYDRHTVIAGQTHTVPTGAAQPERSIPIVDICGVFFEADGWHGYFNAFAQRAPSYIRRFGPKLAQMARVDAGDYLKLVAEDPLAGVEYLASGEGFRAPASKYIASLRAQGVRHQVLHGYPWPTPSGIPVNEQLAAMCATAPDLLQAWAGLDLRFPEEAAKQLERCVRDLGMKGGSLIPFIDGVRPDSQDAMPIYRTAEKLGVPLWIHCGNNFASNLRADLCGWSEIDAIASAFPDLKIVVGHGGWPWVLQFCAVCQRHPNVFIDFSTYRPKVMAGSGSGWEPLFFYGARTIPGQILFGAAQWVHSLSIRELADELTNYVSDKVAELWLHGNAERLLMLEEVPESIY